MKALLALEDETFDQDYLEPNFVRMLRDHKDYLTGLASTQIISLQPADSYRWKGDFNGLLKENGVDPNYRLAIAFLNDLNSFDEWSGEVDIVTIPARNEIAKLLSIYKTTQK